VIRYDNARSETLRSRGGRERAARPRPPAPATKGRARHHRYCAADLERHAKRAIAQNIAMSGHSRSRPPECQPPPVRHAPSSTGLPTQSGPAQIHRPDSDQAVLRDTPCATKTEADSRFHDAVLSPTPAADPRSFARRSWMTISKNIHTDSQLQIGKASKTAVLGRVPPISRPPDLHATPS